LPRQFHASPTRRSSDLAIPGETVAGWRSLLIATMEEPLEPDELEHFRRLTGRQEAPAERVDEPWCVIGRRHAPRAPPGDLSGGRSEEHTSELQSRRELV